MSTFFRLPHIRVAVSDHNGNMTNEWYLALRNLLENVASMDDLKTNVFTPGTDELSGLRQELQDIANQLGQCCTASELGSINQRLEDIQLELSALRTAAGETLLTNTGVTVGTYGDATNVGQFTVGADGRLTFAQNVAISFPAAPASTPPQLFYAHF